MSYYYKDHLLETGTIDRILLGLMGQQRVVYRDSAMQAQSPAGPWWHVQVGLGLLELNFCHVSAVRQPPQKAHPVSFFHSYVPTLQKSAIMMRQQWASVPISTVLGIGLECRAELFRATYSS